MAKKIQVLDLQSVIQPFNVEEAPCNIPWLSEDPEAITFIQVKKFYLLIMTLTHYQIIMKTVRI